MSSDGDLITGLHSGSFASNRPTRAKQSEKKRETRNVLTPSAKAVKEMIDQERTKLTAQLADLPMTFESSEDNVKSVLLAYQMNLNFIKGFESRLNNVMRGKTNG